MTHQSNHAYMPGLADAGGQVSQLRGVLALVEEIAGRQAPPGDGDLDEAARVSAAYAHAAPVVQRRFDRIAGETARWAAIGVETLLQLSDGGRPAGAAAAVMASELRKALRTLGGVARA
jgi:ABC-type transporter Mla subunit MlaD